MGNSRLQTDSSCAARPEMSQSYFLFVMFAFEDFTSSESRSVTSQQGRAQRFSGSEAWGTNTSAASRVVYFTGGRSFATRVCTCLKRDGTLQPQACMMPSSRRMCSRTCRYCSRLCSRRANIAESLRRDATPLLASLEAAGEKEGRREGREKRSQALAPGPASSETQREEETERRLCWGEAAAGDAEQSLPESPVTFPFLFFRMYYRKFHNILYSMKQFV